MSKQADMAWLEELKVLMEKASRGPWKYERMTIRPDIRIKPDGPSEWNQVVEDKPRQDWEHRTICSFASTRGKYELEEANGKLVAFLRNHAPLLLSLAEEGIKAREWVKDAHDCTGDDGHVHGHDNNAKMDAAQAAWNEAIKRTDSLTQKKEDRTDG